jgi:hypothetical protein
MDTIDEVEVKQECIACNTELNSNNEGTTTTSGDPVCDSCVVMCIHCDAVFTVDDDYNDVEGELWCRACTYNDAHWCDLCDEYFTGYTYGTDDSSECMCERCYENNTTYCEDCDLTYLNGCSYNHDDDADSMLIHDYSYRPDPIFHSSEDEQTRLYFGIEVETEARGEDWGVRRTAAEYAHQLENMNLAYLKSDGSLSCGFEIVSHPMSHDYFMKANDFWGTIDKLKSDYSMMAWGTRTCGLHIHISRNGFTGGSHQHRFLQLVYNNKEFYETIAGRSSSHWAKFDDVVDPNTGKKSFRDKFNNRIGSDRYSAVNTNNRNTLEMRIFRGSLNTRFIKSCIDLAHASVEFSRVMTVREVRDNGLDCINLIQYVRERVELYPSLNERLDKLSSVIDALERTERVPTSSMFTEQHS